MTQGTWMTPLGALGIHTELARSILRMQPERFEEDAQAHRYEHAVEVQLPFLQKPGTVRWFVPINIGKGTPEELEKAGRGIAHAVEESGMNVLLINSMQMTSYEPQEKTVKKDQQLLEPLLKLDERRFLQTAREISSSSCGISQTAVTLSAAKSLGASSATLVKYETSGDVFGDTVSVVGYAGITIQ